MFQFRLRSSTDFFQVSDFAAAARLMTVLISIFISLPQMARAEVDAAAAAKALLKFPPMDFFVAKGAPDTCGHGCDTWIAAEGRIVAGTTARLQRVLEKVDNAPIFFSSPGGDLQESLALGRLLRTRTMKAGVAITVATHCVAAHTVAECNKIARDNPQTVATLYDDNALCLSGCAFALLGATNREIAPNAYLGVHSPYLDFRETITQQERNETQQIFRKWADSEIPRYLAEMDFETSLYEIAKATKFEDVYFILRNELYDRRIDRRETLESRWNFDDLDLFGIRDAARKSLAIKTPNPHTEFRTIEFAISCGRGPNGYLLSVLQIKQPHPTTLKIVSGEAAVFLQQNDSTPLVYRGNSMDVRQSRRSAFEIQKMLSSSVIDVFETPASSNDRSYSNTFRISNNGADEAFSSLQSRCR